MNDTLTPKPPRIYQHIARAEWGNAVLLEELADRRVFRFEDGKERTIHANFWEKMVVQSLDSDEAYEIQGRALAGVEAKRVRKVRVPRAKKLPKKPDITFEEQLEIFKSEYEIGFPDVRFRAASVDKAVKRGGELLSAEKLGPLVGSGDFEGAFKAAVKVIEGYKSGVPKSERDRFAALPSESYEAFATALNDWLHGEGSIAARFDALIEALGGEEAAGWQLTTAFGALVHPDELLFVRPSVMRKQALIVDVYPKVMKNPTGAVYEQLLEAGQKLREKLVEAEQHPKDLLDVAQFALRTLKAPAAKKPAAQKADKADDEEAAD